MDGGQAEWLLSRWGDMVWRLCGRLAGAEREDLFQETFLRAMRADIRDIQADSARNLLYTICLNAYRGGYAKRRRRGRVDAPMPEYFDAPAAEDTQAEAHRRLAARAVREAVDRLPDKYRLPVQMHYFAGWSTAQTAQALHMKESTVRANLFRARKKLGSELEEWL